MSRAQAIPMLLSGIQDTSGVPLNAGTVNFYASGTTTDQAVYTDQAKTTEAANPYTLDSNGQAQLYADGNYKLVVKDSGGSTLYTWDSLLFGLDDATSIWGGTSTGSSNAYAITPSPAITTYAAGQTFTFLSNHVSSGAATLNINGLGVTTLKNTDGSAIGASDIANGGLVSVAYNGTDFQLTGAAVSTPISVANGGTSGSTINAAQQGLDLEVGVDVLAYDATIAALAALTKTNNLIPKFDGSTIVSSTIPNAIATVTSTDWTGTVAITGSGSMTLSSLTANEYQFVRMGPWIQFNISINFTTVGTPSTIVYISVPSAGTADDSNTAYPIWVVDGGGVATVNAAWRYNGGTNGATDGIMVFPELGGNWSIGVNAAIHICGRYKI